MRAKQLPVLAGLLPGNQAARSGPQSFILNHSDFASLKNSSDLVRQRREGLKQLCGQWNGIRTHEMNTEPALMDSKTASVQILP